MKKIVILGSTGSIGKTLLNLYPNNPFINIVRSRMLPVEFPLIDSKIKKYISVDPSVKKFMEENNMLIKNAFLPKRKKYCCKQTY